MYSFNLYRLLYKDRKGLYRIVSLLRGFSLTLKMFILLTAEHLGFNMHIMDYRAFFF